MDNAIRTMRDERQLRSEANAHRAKAGKASPDDRKLLLSVADALERLAERRKAIPAPPRLKAAKPAKPAKRGKPAKSLR